MAVTLFKLKEDLATMKKAIADDSSWIAEKAADASASMEDIKEKEEHRAGLVKRLELLQKEHDDMEAVQRTAVAYQHATSGTDEKTVKAKAKANFYRAALGNGDLKKAYEALGGIPALDADLGNGSKLLPSNMSNELITEPSVENPMRAVVRMSNIPGLEEPKLLFDLDDAFDNVTDKDTAKEIELEGDTVSYGRNKVKVKAKVSDTIIHGTTLDISTEIENGLRSGLAANEMYRMFARNPASAYAHMSFYSSVNGIKAVAGATKQGAIAAALADLPLEYRRNAKIVMSAVDWYDMWKDNLNQSGTFYEERPLQLFGKQVVLVDDAEEPIVGDFNYIRVNYDISTTFDTDKDVDSGMYKFVLTAWYDIQLRLKSAFRRVVVTP